MYYEFQFEAERLLALIRNRLRVEMPCVPGVLSLPGHAAVVFDHLEIRSGTYLERGNAPDTWVYNTHVPTATLIRAVQPLRAQLASLDALDTAGSNPLPASG